jgi:hypothetical protein
VLPNVGGALPDLHEHSATWWQWASLGAIGLVYLVSLFRQGVRGFSGQVIAPHSHGDEEESCSHDHHEGGHAHAH